MGKEGLEKAISTLQRDRLESFVKEAEQLEDGCFGYALVSSHNYLYPDRVIPKGVGNKLLGESNGSGIKLVDVIKEVKRLEPDLKLKVDHIINHTSNLTPEQIAKKFPHEDRVPVVNSKDGIVESVSNKSTAIIFLKKRNGEGGHFMALVENPRFQEDGFVKGGNTEYQLIKDRYEGGFTFVLVKSE